MKKVLILRSNQILSDSRTEKYIEFLKEKGVEYSIIGWDRKDSGAEYERAIFYRRKVGYVVGGMKAAVNRLFWFRYLIARLRKMVDKDTMIHACDIDTAFPAALYKFFFNRKAFVLYDVFDWMSAMSAKTNPIIMKGIKFMEWFTLRHIDKLYICEEERRIQIPDAEKYDISVLPNIPMIDKPESVRVVDKKYYFDNNLPTLSYVGWFSYGRFLDELIDVAKKKKINLLIAGYGNKEIEDACSDTVSNDNIRYYGRVDYLEGLKMMYNSDLMYAMYCKVEPNHIYAAPNKFYECMLLGKPIITTKGIIIGDKVEKLNIGYTIEETEEELIDLVDHIDTDDLKQKSQNCLMQWEKVYSSYTKDFLNQNYYQLITSN